MPLEQYTLLADYNRWMNTKVYAAASRLTAVEVAAERGAFFGSILGTLNHLVVADTVWLKRFANMPDSEVLAPIAELPTPTALNMLKFAELAALREHRHWLDGKISVWIGGLEESALAQPLRYTNMQGSSLTRPLATLLTQFFNHQTHHRGQVTTLLTQAGQDVGVTDFLGMLLEEAR